jgi:flagellar biosynthesis protein FlhF
MSVKRFLAPSAREALAQLRKALGEDAVILSNRAVAGGVELCAVAADGMQALLDPQMQMPERRPAPAMPAPREPIAAGGRNAPRGTAREDDAPMVQGFQEYVKSVAAKRKPVQTVASADSTANFVRERNERARKPQPPATPGNADVHSEIPLPQAPEKNTALLAEIQSMKGMLQEQRAAFAWFDATHKHPLHAKLMGLLLGAGFSPALSRYVVEHLPADFGEERAQTWVAEALARNLPCQNAQDNVIDRGGVFALVGPTGVGKTTTTAKLAARYALRHGAQRVGLITTDSYRIGAHDQLRIYGKILGIPVQLAQGNSLRGLIESMRDKHVILVDTVGVGQRDARVPEQLEQLGEAGARKVLLLSAAAQGETLEEVIQVYRRFGVDSALITKIDEANKLGQVLDCVMRHKLALPFVTNGQRVPEDLHPAHASFLVHRALKAATAPAFELSEEDMGILFSRTPMPHNPTGQRHARGATL